MHSKIVKYMQDMHFNPGFLALFTNPFYFARSGLYHHISELAPMIQGKILDVGCGSKPYRSLFPDSIYIGMEISRKNKNADCYYDGQHFPFSNEEIDSILASQVLEHVFNPDEFLSEINRVLKIGGMLLLTVPFVWDEHEQPYDYARYSSFGLQHLLKTHGFEIIEHRKSINDVRIIFQMMNAYLYKKTKTKRPRINFLVTLMLMAPMNIIGEVLGKILPSNADLYLDNIVLARKKDTLKT